MIYINSLPNFEVISIPLLRKSMGTLEIMSHKIFPLTGNISDDQFLNSVTDILNYSAIILFFKNEKLISI